MVSEKGVNVSDDHLELLKNLIESHELLFDDNTPQSLLWNQQKEFASKYNSRGMRWHPLIIRWCLSIYHSFPATYRQLSNKNLGPLNLPHINTLLM